MSLSDFFSTPHSLLGFELVMLLWVAGVLGTLAGLVVARRLGRRHRELEKVVTLLAASELVLQHLLHGIHRCTDQITLLKSRLEAGAGRGMRPSGGYLPHLVFVVKEGRREVFRTLQEQVAQAGVIEITWDRRRQVERRVGTEPVLDERRRASRRHPPPPRSWDTLGFVLVRADAVIE